MEYFLPIAQVEINILYIFGLSLAVGILSGLIFMGVPPIYAVPNEASNILGTSVSGSTTHYLKGTLDYKMGFMIVIGGIVGTVLGIITFSYFKDIGKINVVISLAYMYILAILGTFMLIQGVSEIDKARKKITERKKLHKHYWIHGLPLRMRFKKSQLYESAFTPIIIGLIVGFIAAIMGIGGAFILVPAMIYIIGMPTRLIPGTSLFVTIFVSAIVTILHALNYGTIDLILVFVLILGSIIGVQFGQKIGEKIDSSEFKTILAILLLLVGIAIAYDTFIKDENSINAAVNTNENLGALSQFILSFSEDMPIFYGLTSVLLAVVLGVGAAMIRRVYSNWNDSRLAKLKK